MSDNLIKADIFFIVTTVAVILLTIGLAWALYYAINILRDVKYLSSKVKSEGENIINDVKTFREQAKEKSSGIFQQIISGFFSKIIKPSKKRSESKSKE